MAKPTRMDREGYLKLCRELCPKLDFFGQSLWQTTWTLDETRKDHYAQLLSCEQGMDLCCKFDEARQRVTVYSDNYSASFAVNRPLGAIASEIHSKVIKPYHPHWLKAKQEAEERAQQEREINDIADRLQAILNLGVLSHAPNHVYGFIHLPGTNILGGKHTCKIEARVNSSQSIEVKFSNLPPELVAYLFHVLIPYANPPEEAEKTD